MGENNPDVKDLNIKGVYQLQGGIDKYFREFPDGGYWVGKNYVFDKRFSHAPPAIEGRLRSSKIKSQKTNTPSSCNNDIGNNHISADLDSNNNNNSDDANNNILQPM